MRRLVVATLVLLAAAVFPQEEIARLIRNLGDPDVSVREEAANELILRGPAAVAPLRRAARSGDAETRARADEIIGKIRSRTADVLKDDDLDRIAAAHDWSSKEHTEKTRAGVLIRGTVPAAAAADAFAAVLRKHGVPGTKEKGFAWRNAALDAGFRYAAAGRPESRRIVTIAEVPWSSRSSVGRRPDVPAARRDALRKVAGAAAGLYLDLVSETTGAGTPEALGELLDALSVVMKKGEGAATAREKILRVASREERLRLTERGLIR